MAQMSRAEVRQLVLDLTGGESSQSQVKVVDRIGDGVKRLSIGLAFDNVKPSCLVLIGEEEGAEDNFLALVRQKLEETGHSNLVVEIAET